MRIIAERGVKYQFGDAVLLRRRIKNVEVENPDHRDNVMRKAVILHTLTQSSVNWSDNRKNENVNRGSKSSDWHTRELYLYRAEDWRKLTRVVLSCGGKLPRERSLVNSETG
ncbi:hypothetical protein RRG08_064011 [Elysia crispata]|uniref:Uncharacterized protein n=1 Tax=Elysia crispata TaxID=231223 RepID=A0AAE1CY45_9GAST|nr:hypothetical protein RRG08_064011 [Elysia crispata]